jgi:hypothetical protein
VVGRCLHNQTRFLCIIMKIIFAIFTTKVCFWGKKLALKWVNMHKHAQSGHSCRRGYSSQQAFLPPNILSRQPYPTDMYPAELHLTRLLRKQIFRKFRYNRERQETKNIGREKRNSVRILEHSTRLTLFPMWLLPRAKLTCGTGPSPTRVSCDFEPHDPNPDSSQRGLDRRIRRNVLSRTKPVNCAYR